MAELLTLNTLKVMEGRPILDLDPYTTLFKKNGMLPKAQTALLQKPSIFESSSFKTSLPL
jgi:hypothetical protein